MKALTKAEEVILSYALNLKHSDVKIKTTEEAVNEIKKAVAVIRK